MREVGQNARVHMRSVAGPHLLPDHRRLQPREYDLGSSTTDKEDDSHVTRMRDVNPDETPRCDMTDDVCSFEYAGTKGIKRGREKR